MMGASVPVPIVMKSNKNNALAHRTVGKFRTLAHIITYVDLVVSPDGCPARTAWMKFSFAMHTHKGWLVQYTAHCKMYINPERMIPCIDEFCPVEPLLLSTIE